MTRPLRMAGVVVVATFAIVLPSLALGSSHPAAPKPGGTTTTIMCPLAGGAETVPKVDTQARSRHHRHHRRHHRHGKPRVNAGATGATMPCLPFPCIYTGKGASGPGGATLPCRPPPCLGATGTTGATGPTGVVLFCRPIPCFSSTGAATGSIDPTGGTGPICPPIPCATPPAAGSSAVIVCGPLPCPIGGTVKQGKASATIVACPPIPLCPLTNRAASACPQPCSIAGGSSPTAPNRVSPGCSPGCPPEPVAGTVRTGLHACPQVGAGTSVSSSHRLS